MHPGNHLQADFPPLRDAPSDPVGEEQLHASTGPGVRGTISLILRHARRCSELCSRTHCLLIKGLLTIGQASSVVSRDRDDPVQARAALLPFSCVDVPEDGQHTQHQKSQEAFAWQRRQAAVRSRPL